MDNGAEIEVNPSVAAESGSSFPSDQLSLRLQNNQFFNALSATGSSVDHMSCFGDAAGRLQETALDASTKGNRYINSCLRKHLRRNVDVLDRAVNKLIRPP
ncbi:unnamed protein product [Eruca vesicaria subsp. sativa]|uniref:Uncharacterized protein n=1 Tax=Eruca vesicaria subsp. sativa TaxID=29727 RepID=A0ABC8K7K4_ERUVS|nr:unnamed protein product [Eruca vesicaria subsp. sativa]